MMECVLRNCDEEIVIESLSECECGCSLLCRLLMSARLFRSDMMIEDNDSSLNDDSFQ